MGKEGRQAVRCSDFAFARFRFLRRALLVHGHWYYWRISNTVQYFFYKNIVFNTPVVFFTIFSAYSTQVSFIVAFNILLLIIRKHLIFYALSSLCIPVFFLQCSTLLSPHCQSSFMVYSIKTSTIDNCWTIYTFIAPYLGIPEWVGYNFLNGICSV